jgi:hypothetical protein
VNKTIIERTHFAGTNLWLCCRCDEARFSNTLFGKVLANAEAELHLAVRFGFHASPA